MITHPSQVTLFPSARSWPLAPGVRLIALWLQRRRQRLALGRFDDRLLRDIGVTRSEADRECATPFWR